MRAREIDKLSLRTIEREGRDKVKRIGREDCSVRARVAQAGARRVGDIAPVLAVAVNDV